MDEHAGGRRRADPPPWSPPLQLPPDDMLLEILLRLPPEPIHLFRASFVSKHWRGLVHDARFRRRFREFHGGTPPMLGFFNSCPGAPIFVPTSGGFALSTANMSLDWRALDCRHGRALLHNYGTRTLLVWDPMTGDERYLPFPTRAHLENVHYNGAVLCAAGHTGHGDCHSCPFLVAFVFSSYRYCITSACVYSSVTGVWGEITSIHTPDSLVDAKPTALVGNTLYCLLSNEDSIIEFNLDKNSLDLIEVPYGGNFIITLAQDGPLGFASVDRFSLHLWSRVASIDGVASWEHIRVIDLEKLFAPQVLAACMDRMWPVGYAEDANVIFIHVYPRTYMIHLKSMQIEGILEEATGWSIFPYASFYTPGPGITTGGGDDQVELLNGT
ncbi:hypothetical protein CFC21_074850 [Triticum aestivum]|uniref:F-box domain-containing protein n=2 Tax=Triticum aestivum TaxID=4565 RepID=A0A3B6LXN8_WHEAT|nr:uncharacterized protein LOC123114231 [Triticum aestivum]KAF7069187.1 hypothetical protein CFC21_074850 [Triticum aestivum]